MANVHSYFIQFHQNIKLDYDDNKVLRDKREELLTLLKDNMPSSASTFSIFHQGSYAMHTGIKPLDGGDYDIDVGLLFDISKDDYANPIDVKRWVYNALENHSDEVKMKLPCVTVTFIDSDTNDDGNKEKEYHVDFAIYSNANSDQKTYLAKGKLNSDSDHRSWEESDPKTLVDTIKNNSTNEKDRQQFRRVIRYMKRWKDIKFNGEVNRPSGIGFTVAALTHFVPKSYHDWTSNTTYYNDLDALITYVNNMINAFYMTINAQGEIENRLAINLPTPPYSDVYEKMSGTQMKRFKEKLEELLEKLEEARDEIDPVVACGTLQKMFGDDFPVPSESETAEQKNLSIMVDHSSAYIK